MSSLFPDDTSNLDHLDGIGRTHTRSIRLDVAPTPPKKPTPLAGVIAATTLCIALAAACGVLLALAVAVDVL